MIHQLENYSWNSLNNSQIKLTIGTDTARRYAAGGSNILAFESLMTPDFDAIRPFCQIGAPFYCAGLTNSLTDEWKLLMEGEMLLMVFEGEPPSPKQDLNIVTLGEKDVPQILALTDLVSPGPFGPRTCEVGEYIGIFDGDKLISIAGERFWAPPFREISAVCTHPDYQRRGLAKSLIIELLNRQSQRREVSTLHVISNNHTALDLYSKLGFTTYKAMSVRLVERLL